MKIFSSFPKKSRMSSVPEHQLKRQFELIDWCGSNEFKHNGQIFNDIQELLKMIELINTERGAEQRIIAVSGGFDPIHIGHVRYIQSAAKICGESGLLVVIANKDSWLQRKKGFAFMSEKERMEILASVRGVDFVLPWDDGSRDVSGCLRILKPHIFANGGDRDSIENVPEYSVCKEIECKMVFGVGGGKIQSSSDLVNKSKVENGTKGLRK